MIGCAFYLDPHGKLIDQLNIEQIKSFSATGEGLLWLDMENVTDEDGQFLLAVFHFHPLAVADCVSKNIHFPKIDEFEDHLYRLSLSS